MSAIEDQMALQLDAALPWIGEYQRELRFHPERRWRFDFAWPVEKVALEVEGGTWMAGRHTRGVGVYGDAQKYNEAALLGWLVLRVTPHMIRDGQALAFVERALAQRRDRG